jgi:aerotaxis receptor
MRVNLPITGQEIDYDSQHMLVSVTDTRGHISHCNRAFIEVSGYTQDELLGENHNLIRHPDVPAAAFKDLWSTIGRGKPWTGVVKNRAKSGDHYWVVANVTPIMRNGKPQSYMSVRTKPSRSQIEAADKLYAQINTATQNGTKLPFTLYQGQLIPNGWRGWLTRLGQRSLTLRLALGLAAMVGVGLLPVGLHLPDPYDFWAHLGALAVGAAVLLTWFHHQFDQALNEAERFARDLAGCNLTTEVNNTFSPPMSDLIRKLQQIQINLRGVVGDVRREIGIFSVSAQEVANGGISLSERTASQASNLNSTANAMEQLALTVQHTEQIAEKVTQKNRYSTEVAQKGGQAVHRVEAAMLAIDASSVRVQEIIGVIEGIAFQTNILALNAAVEAARAGEQGRGFAVVASEVRALAQRSAVAAKEIHELIAGSVRQISQGTQEMKSASDTIDAVVESVSSMSGLVLEITDASQAQAFGIAQVNDAVKQLDAVTQQNRMQVDHSATASDDLKHSGEMLEQAAAVFHLP